MLKDNKLSLLRTYFALSRNYMASIRTNAIFIGISIGIITFMKLSKSIIVLLILIISLLVNICSTYYYHVLIKDVFNYNLNINDDAKISYFNIKYIPISYSIILIIFQLIIIYNLSIKYIKK